MRAPQWRQRPRSTNHDNTGTLSRGEMGVSQPGQCDGGATTDSPRGMRQITTFRNEPISRPKSALMATIAAVIARRVDGPSQHSSAPPPPLGGIVRTRIGPGHGAPDRSLACLLPSTYQEVAAAPS